MSERIIDGFNEMRQVYINNIAGNYLTEEHRYVNYLEEKKSCGNIGEDDCSPVKKPLVGNQPELDVEPNGGDNDIDSNDLAALRREVKPKTQKESFSNWRNDLKEVIDEIDDTQVKEKKVKNEVTINPVIGGDGVNEGTQVGDLVELDEEYVNDIVNIATEYFYEQGLNEYGLEMVIEELGEDKFVEYVFDLGEEYFLNEAFFLKKSESNVKTSKAPKGTKQYQTTNARIKKGGQTITTKRPQSTISKKILKDRGEKATQAAAQAQPSTTTQTKPSNVKDRLARGILGAISAVEDGVKRHKKATTTASGLAGQTVKTIGKAAKVAKEAGERAAASPEGIRAARLARTAFGAITNKIRDDIEKTKQAASAARSGEGRPTDRVGAFVRGLWEEELQEKAESQQQQKLFGLALSVVRGETPRTEVSKEVLNIVDNVSEKEIRKFAKTKHENLPKRADVQEALDIALKNGDVEIVRELTEYLR